MSETAGSFKIAWGLPFGPWLTGLLALLLLFWVLRDLRMVWQRIGFAPRRRVLALLRVCTALVALLLLVQPEGLIEHARKERGRIAVLFDVSRSMALADGKTSRAEQAKEVLQRFSRRAPEAALFTFGSEVAPAVTRELLRAYPTDADQTRIGAALRGVRRAVGGDLGALVVVSDGADSAGAVAEETLAELGTRVHVVPVGGRGPERDDAIIDVRADPLAFLRQRAEVEVQVQRSPAESGTVNVSLRRDGELITEIPALLDGDGRGKVLIPFDVTELGRMAYTVSIPVAQGDDIPQNNERAFLMRARRDRLRVLLVCGRPGWDARFLRAFLKDNPGIDLITFFILRTANDMSMAAPEELSLIPFPTDELFREHLDSFDLVLFQDFNYGPYQMAQYLPRVREYVLAGGSFAMIGGDLSFSAGGYRGTPVAEILPVELPSPEGSLLPGSFQPQLADGMLAHPLVELAPEPVENARRWAELAPLLGANLLGSPADGASTLLVHPSEKMPDGAPRPLLVVGSAGKGRSLAFAADSSYRWGITTAGRTGDASTYERFWDRTLRWLTRDPLLEAAQVRTDRERYGPMAKVEVSFVLRDHRYQPAASQQVRVSIVDADGQVLAEELVPADSSGRGEVALVAPQAPGAYRVRAKVSREEGSQPAEEVPEAEEAFVVEAAGQELAQPFPNRPLLAEIAERTGGTVYEPDDIDPASIARTRSKVLGVSRERMLGQPMFFAVLAALFMVEWVLRRRWGLR